MQDVYRQIFELACKELPYKRIVLGNSEAVMFRGFKISKQEDVYYWQDTRYNSYYEPVDPIITENILKQGFLKTLTLVRIYNNEEKIYQIDQEIIQIRKDIDLWTDKSRKNWEMFKNQETKILNDSRLTSQMRREKLADLNKQYLIKKAFYSKKRGVLKRERDHLKAEKIFYSSQIQIYKNENYGS